MKKIEISSLFVPIRSPTLGNDRKWLKVFICASLSALICSLSTPAFAEGWDESWTKCREITIANAGSTTLTNFPAYISLAYDSDMQSDYDDIRFIDTTCDNNGSELDFEIESYTVGASGSADVWVKIDSLPAAGKTIAVYYGNPSAASGENVNGVWDSNHQGVWHLGENTGDNNQDSTSNSNTGKPKKKPASIGGKIGSALNFEVDKKTYVDVGKDNSLKLSDYNNWTISLWVKPSSDFTDNDYPTMYTYGDYSVSVGLAVEAGSNGLIETRRNDSSPRFNNTKITTGAWNHVVVVRTSTNTLFYLNGVADGSGSSVTINSDNNGSFIGGYKGYEDGDLKGVIDEVRVSDVNRSADWIKQSYQLVENQSTHVSTGAELESEGGDGDDDDEPSQCLAVENGIYGETMLKIGSGVTMNGDSVSSGDTSDNSITPSGAIDNPSISLTSLGSVTFGTSDITVNNNGVLSPGSYKHVTVSQDADITMAGGDYYIDYFDVKKRVTIILLGPVTLHVGKFDLDDDVEMNGPYSNTDPVTSSGDAGNLTVKWYGGGTEDNKFHIHKRVKFTGIIYSTGVGGNEGVKFHDEVKFFGGIFTDNIIKTGKDTEFTYGPTEQAAAAAVFNCNVAVIHHYEIVHDGQGLTCDTESVTINACTDESCSIENLSTESVTLDFLADGAVINTPTFNGSVTFNFNHTVVETLTFSVANATTSAAEPFVCDDGITASCVMTFTDAGFRFLYGNSITLPNQTSGSVFSDTLKLQAVENTDGVCTGLFIGNKNIDLSQENVAPGGTSGLSFSIAGNNIAKHSGVTSTTLNFGGDSIATIPTPIYYDAGKIRLHAYYDIGGVALSGSSNSFWVSPAELVVSAKSGTTTLNGATAIATPTHKAGEIFDLSVTAFNSLGVITTNYSPGQMQLKLTRTGPTNHGVDGALTYGSSGNIMSELASVLPTFKNVTLDSTLIPGIFGTSAAKYSEVGLLNLDVQDSNYGNASIVIPATAINIGRFISDHFTQTIAEDGYLFSTCNTGTTFAYSGQRDELTDSIGAISYLTNPIFVITAYNKQGNITQNYYEDSQGSVNDYMKLSGSDVSVTVPALDQAAIGVDGNPLNLLPLTANMYTGTLSQNDLTTAVPDDNPLPKGVLHYQFSNDDNFFYNRSANALVKPFTSDIDFSIATIKDEDNVNVSTTVDASPTGVEIRFGRLVLENSFGPETSNLPQPMKVEHFDGTAFIVTSNNNCLSYDASKISLTNISLDPTTVTNEPEKTGSFVAGKTQEIELKATGSGNQGEIGVSYDGNDWLKYDWDNDGAYDNNPTAVATFGVFRGNDRIISWREVGN